MATTSTVLQDVGSGGKTLAIFGDGFAAGADQTIYNNYVTNEVMSGVFLRDAFNEDVSAWNIIRVNFESKYSGASTRTWNPMGTPTDPKDDTFTENIVDTTFDIISNGAWWHNWFEDGKDTACNILLARAFYAPKADFVLIVVNSALQGGLRSGDVLKVTTVESAAIIAHEFGHGFANLEDEYSKSGKGKYTDSEPKRVNVTIEKKSANVKWRQFIAPSTPVPTGTGADAGYNVGTKPAGWDDQADAGLFEGGATYETGIYKPAVNCRMRHNTDEFCPVCYTEMKEQHHSKSGRSFVTTVPGRFTSSGRSEFFGIHPRGVSLYRADGARWAHVRSTAGEISGGWGIRPGDQYLAGDFDGDGRDELVVYNATWGSTPVLGLIKVAPDGSLKLMRRYDGDLPGWGGFARGDGFLVGDLDGDGRDDLLATNFTDWSMPYMATFISTGTGFRQTRRYDGDVPGWGGMARGDRVQLGDFAGTGRSDVLMWNSTDWSSIYLGLFRMGRNGLRCIRMYTDDLPGWGGFAEHDQIYVGDFNADGKDDLYLFNGRDWSEGYLGMFRSTGSAFVRQRLYEDDVPGWGGLREHDRFLPVDLTGDGRVGLFAWNMFDWGPNYAGRMRSTGTGLAADWREDWVGEWRLGGIDRFTAIQAPVRRIVVTDVEHKGSAIIRRRLPGEHLLIASGPDRVLAHNREWLATIRTAAPLTLDNIYNRWVHNYRHGRNW